VEEEEHSLPPPEEVEAVSFPSFSDWSSSDDDSKRNLEDDKDAATETLEDSPRLKWWEEAERKAEEEEYEMLEDQEAQLEFFATARKKERTRAAVAHAVREESSPHGHAAYWPARSFLLEDSPRLHAFGRPLWKGARHLRATYHAPQMVKALPPPPSSSPRMRSDVLKVALII
jgi:hypothetical protein